MILASAHNEKPQNAAFFLPQLGERGRLSGGGGIRTHETRGPGLTVSRPSHSTALPPLRVGTEGRASGARYLGRRAELVQHLRHADRAVVLLVVLHDGDDR